MDNGNYVNIVTLTTKKRMTLSKSVTGYIAIINGEVIAWYSRIQKKVTLSVTEAEYSAITELCCRIIFIRDILLFMGVVFEYPIILHVDNIGAIFLPYNTSSSAITQLYRYISSMITYNLALKVRYYFIVNWHNSTFQ